MKLFHLSDLHIGKQLHRYSMNLEQREILAQVVELAREEKPDVVMIAGDVYDSRCRLRRRCLCSTDFCGNFAR